MKRLWSGLMLFAVLLALLTACAAQGRLVKPLAIGDKGIDTAGGTYRAMIRDTDRIFSGGYFTASLYQVDEYDPSEIEALQPGDRIQINGRICTVEGVEVYDEDVRELYFEEDWYSYILFNKEGNTYTATVDDWTPVTFLSDYRVMMPLANDFAFGWVDGADDATVYGADAFVQLITGRSGESVPDLGPYNTLVSFKDGLLMTILHADYPEGPEA